MAFTIQSWRSIDGYSDYQISNNGEIMKGDRLLKPSPNSEGYLVINLRNANGKKTLKVSRLIAKAFISELNSNVWVVHKNGNKNDLRLINLELINKYTKQPWRGE